MGVLYDGPRRAFASAIRCSISNGSYQPIQVSVVAMRAAPAPLTLSIHDWAFERDRFASVGMPKFVMGHRQEEPIPGARGKYERRLIQVSDRRFVSTGAIVHCPADPPR